MNKPMLVYGEYPPRGYPPDEQPPAVWEFRDEYRDNREESEKELAMPAWERPCMLNDILNDILNERRR